MVSAPALVACPRPHRELDGGDLLGRDHLDRRSSHAHDHTARAMSPHHGDIVPACLRSDPRTEAASVGGPGPCRTRRGPATSRCPSRMTPVAPPPPRSTWSRRRSPQAACDAFACPTSGPHGGRHGGAHGGRHGALGVSTIGPPGSDRARGARYSGWHGGAQGGRHSAAQGVSTIGPPGSDRARGARYSGWHGGARPKPGRAWAHSRIQGQVRRSRAHPRAQIRGAGPTAACPDGRPEPGGVSHPP